MEKIPTIFERDWDGDRSRVLDVINPVCQWVFDGEGVATRKLDGTSCMVRGNRLFKRREIKKGKSPPPDFDIVERDETTGKTVGWVPVGDGPEDKFYREAWTGCDKWPDGTYELVGPKVQGNPEGFQAHLLIRHGGGPAGELDFCGPRTFNEISAFLATRDIEGIVFHGPDGRAAKIKKRDFGLKRNPTVL